MSKDGMSADEVVSLRDQLDVFLRSPVGKYIIDRVEDAERDAIEALLDVDVTDLEAIQKSRNDVWRARQFNTWLYEIIVTSNQILEQRSAPPDA